MSSTVHRERYHDMQLIYGAELFQKFRTSKVLVVGAGGIGCELLKDLVLSGFEDIEIEHVGKSKAVIARESALRFNPHAKIVAHHGNIKHAQFGPEYFKQFVVALNALDNVDARRHVNRMCLAADVPLIDGGTAGYLGQVMTVKKGETECYECKPKQTQKGFAVCTIRSNPSTMVHCVVWAKLLFERLFGKPDDANAITELAEIITGSTDTTAETVAERIFEKIYTKDISDLLEMKTNGLSWNAGMPPQPLLLRGILAAVEETEGAGKAAESASSGAAIKDQRVWSLPETTRKFLDATAALRKVRVDKNSPLDFDKDDELALDFVTAAANLRAHNFHITNHSRFDVKAMAGNIVPAIATTNAIISGMMVLETIKVIGGHLDQCRLVHCVRQPAMNNRKQCLLYPSELEKPNQDCYACSSNFVTVVANCRETKLEYFVKEILMNRLGLLEPMINIGSELLFEVGEDLDAEERAQNELKLARSLENLGITNSITIDIEDFRQEISWRIVMIHSEIPVEEFEIHGKSAQVKVRQAKTEEEAAVPAAPAPAATTVPPAAAASTGDVITIDDEDEEMTDAAAAARGTKRKREDEDATVAASGPAPADGQPEAKKAKQDDDDTILID